MSTARTLGRPLTRSRYSDRMKVGEAGWHKEGHLVMLVERTPRGFRRLRIMQTKENGAGGQGWWRPEIIKPGVFKLDPGTLLLTDKRVRQLEKELGINGRRQIRKIKRGTR